MSFIKKIGLVCFIVFCCAGCRSAGEKLVESAAAPRIINIINSSARQTTGWRTPIAYCTRRFVSK